MEVMSKLIICAGRGRSGSTLQYNIIRFTYYYFFGSENVYATAHVRDYNRNNKSKYHIIKSHEPHDFLFKHCDEVYSSIRDPEDQKRSRKNHAKKEKNQDLTETQLSEWFDYDEKRWIKWKSNKNFKHTFYFEDIINKNKVIEFICDSLNKKYSQEIYNFVSQELNKLKLPQKGYDKLSGLTSQHITSNKYKNNE